MSIAWDKYQSELSGFTLEELAILRPEYEKYLERSHKWQWNKGNIMSFDDWWRSQADEAKDRAKYAGE